MGKLVAEPTLVLLLKHVLPPTSLLPNPAFCRWTAISFGDGNTQVGQSPTRTDGENSDPQGTARARVAFVHEKDNPEPGIATTTQFALSGDLHFPPSSHELSPKGSPLLSSPLAAAGEHHHHHPGDPSPCLSHHPETPHLSRNGP